MEREERLPEHEAEATPSTAYRLLALVRGKPKPKRPPEREAVLTFPHFLALEALAALFFIVLLMVVSLAWNAPLEAPADPARTPNPAKAPWYFAGLQEMLVYFDPWIAGVMLPAVIIVGLVLLPYVDLTPGEGIGTWFCWRKRRFEILFFAAGLLLWFGLMLIGVYCRGPGWEWYWPWESWEVHKESKVALSQLPPVVGGLMVPLHLAAGAVIAIILRRRRFGHWPAARYYTVAAFVVLSTGVPFKMVLRLIFYVKYVLHTPWFNI